MSKIYIIECLETGERYVGSTKMTLGQRIAIHKKKSVNRCSSKQIIDRGNYKSYIIEEVEPTQRLIREQYHMDNTDNCINYNRAYRTEKEKKEWNKTYHIRYRELNKESNKKYFKEYHNLHRDYKNKKRKENLKYQNSWGGNKRHNNNLLQISLDLFN